VTHLLYKYVVSTPINPKYTLFVCFLKYNSKYKKKGSHCKAIVLKFIDDRKNKGEESESFCSDMHLQSLKLGGSTEKTTRKLCQAIVVEVPGEAETKQQCETVYYTHSQRPDWYERSVHYT